MQTRVEALDITHIFRPLPSTCRRGKSGTAVRRTLTTEPRVAQRTLGFIEQKHRGTLKGFDKDDAVKPLQGLKSFYGSNPGCAARPWAMLFNGFAVQTNVTIPSMGRVNMWVMTSAKARA
jgi:hypothetical protein